MTTIAYRNGVIACDTAFTAGDFQVGQAPKIVRSPIGDLAAATGSAVYLAAFLRWVGTGEEGVPPDAHDSEAGDKGAIFRRDGTITVFEPPGRFTLQAPYFAIGSGRSVALGAMHAGATAEQAVAAAIEHDPYSRGPVMALRHA